MFEDMSGQQVDHLITIAQCKTMEKIAPLLKSAGPKFSSVVANVISSDKGMSTMMSQPEGPLSEEDIKKIANEGMSAEQRTRIDKLVKQGYNARDLVSAYAMELKIGLCEKIAIEMARIDPKFKDVNKWEWMLYVHHLLGRRIETVTLKKG